MEHKELLAALNHLKVETGSLACLGCGYEHNCGVSGCAVMREAADRIANQSTHIAALQQEIEKLRGQVPRWIPVKERLPKDRSNVLVVAYWYERWGVYMSWCAPERAEWNVHVGIGDRNDVTVTHWMPLPEPPKEVACD